MERPTKTDAELGFAGVLQAGTLFFVTDHVGLSFDVKRMWVLLDDEANHGTLGVWVLSSGVQYTF